MSFQVLVDRCLVHRVLIVVLVALVLGQGLLLWGTEREVQLLPRLARTGELPAQGQIQDLGLPELLDGLSCLGGAPELMLDQTQAKRLVPVVPLVRRPDWGWRPGVNRPPKFGPMLGTIWSAPASSNWPLAVLAQKGELASKPDVALEKLACWTNHAPSAQFALDSLRLSSPRFARAWTRWITIGPGNSVARAGAGFRLTAEQAGAAADAVALPGHFRAADRVTARTSCPWWTPVRSIDREPAAAAARWFRPTV